MVDTFFSLRNTSLMDKELIHKKADRIRDVIRYLRKFKNALIIIYLDENLLDSPLFLSHIKDICLIHEAGLQVILVPGASKRIDNILKNEKIEWSFHCNCRITSPEAMPLIKMAAFDVSNQIMTAFAGESKTAVIGNWVRARGKGVVDGFDYGITGEIDKLEVESIKTVLENGFIPIFPCIGWSVAGKPYNISSVELAEQIAIHLKADKLFYMIPDAEISSETFIIPEGTSIPTEGTVPSMDLKEVDAFLKANQNQTTERSVANPLLHDKILSLLELAKKACLSDVTRVHIIDGSIDGTLPCEIFSDLGSGTMIYSSNYGKVRPMVRSDIAAVLRVMKPFVDSGLLLPRTKQSLLEQLDHYIVYEIDGGVRACASLIPYESGQMEIAGVAVHESCSHIGVGPKMIDYLIKRAKDSGAKEVFLLTTKTADWFERLGFVSSDISTIPEQRRKIWTPERGSKVLSLKF